MDKEKSAYCPMCQKYGLGRDMFRCQGCLEKLDDKTVFHICFGCRGKTFFIGNDSTHLLASCTDCQFKEKEMNNDCRIDNV